MDSAVLTGVDASLLYETRADEFADRYATVSFAEVHVRLLPHLPPGGSRVLDVGAGGGRDAIALARLGHRVVAAEPSGGLRRRAAADDVDGLVNWIDDRLPELRRIKALGVRFDLILCSAVLIHVAPAQLDASMASMASLLSESGRLGITVRQPVKGESRALFHDHGAAAVAAAAWRSGLVKIERWRAIDALGRPRAWDGFVFAASA